MDYSNGPRTTASATPIIQTEIDHQDKALAALGATVYALENRLDLVLSPASPEPSKVDPPPAAPVRIFERIRLHTDRIEEVRRRLDAVMERLHL